MEAERLAALDSAVRLDQLGACDGATCCNNEIMREHRARHAAQALAVGKENMCLPWRSQAQGDHNKMSSLLETPCFGRNARVDVSPFSDDDADVEEELAVMARHSGMLRAKSACYRDAGHHLKKQLDTAEKQLHERTAATCELEAAFAVQAEDARAVFSREGAEVARGTDEQAAALLACAGLRCRISSLVQQDSTMSKLQKQAWKGPSWAEENEEADGRSTEWMRCEHEMANTSQVQFLLATERLVQQEAEVAAFRQISLEHASKLEHLGKEEMDSLSLRQSEAAAFCNELEAQQKALGDLKSAQLAAVAESTAAAAAEAAAKQLSKLEASFQQVVENLAKEQLAESKLAEQLAAQERCNLRLASRLRTKEQWTTHLRKERARRGSSQQHCMVTAVAEPRPDLLNMHVPVTRRPESNATVFAGLADDAESPASVFHVEVAHLMTAAAPYLGLRLPMTVGSNRDLAHLAAMSHAAAQELREDVEALVVCFGLQKFPDEPVLGNTGVRWLLRRLQSKAVSRQLLPRAGEIDSELCGWPGNQLQCDLPAKQVPAIVSASPPLTRPQTPPTNSNACTRSKEKCVWLPCSTEGVPPLPLDAKEPSPEKPSPLPQHSSTATAASSSTNLHVIPGAATNVPVAMQEVCRPDHGAVDVEVPLSVPVLGGPGRAKSHNSHQNSSGLVGFCTPTKNGSSAVVPMNSPPCSGYPQSLASSPVVPHVAAASNVSATQLPPSQQCGARATATSPPGSPAFCLRRARGRLQQLRMGLGGGPLCNSSASAPELLDRQSMTAVLRQRPPAPWVVGKGDQRQWAT